jgi:Domain of unknown function (DUF932)
MTRRTTSNFTSQQPLTIEQIGQYAPSALAVRAHESRSDRYAYIPTLDVIKGMMNAGFQPFKASQSSTRVEGKGEFTKHMIRFRRDGAQLTNVGDSVPEIVLVNSHDGTSAYKLIAGMFRLVCSNGLVIADSTIASVSVHHKGNVLDNVIEGSYRIISDSQVAMDRVAEWSNLQLTAGEQSAFAAAAHTLRFADSEGKVATPIVPAQLLQSRRHWDNGSDLWKTFNRVQENVIQGGLSARTRSGYDAEGHFVPSRRVSTRQVKGIDQDVRLNRSLWQLAEKMAELHTGVAAA